ncbi:Leucine-rich receptor-like protein kinase family protein [Rhynchospora pubera]|uniref:Leucine-rich receptor-like protein kinase family protein n=1 Tax=Rhynchospora pubera TaxID=906938 RepID=A0AAV8DZH2_9POAL|nr:Leucine-rich receptor-like protein kinase family protein [Rhynchospora pubera]
MFGLLHFLFLRALPAIAGDSDLLISFKNSLANPSLLSDWNHAKGVCDFRGVACKEGYVSSLTIRELPLGADFSSVSAHILSLPNLETLSLHSTNLSGSISAPAKCTVQLKKLDLSSNDLRGSVSDVASLAVSCSSLQSLNLSNNSIGQAFYRSYPFLLNLKMLDLSYNKIATNKDLQWLFSQLGLFQHLDLSHNNIPGSLSNLKYLMMWQNNLNGEIPGKLSSLRSLRNLVLDYNNLTGTIPDGLVNCRSLNWISLASNRLTGSIPNWIGLSVSVIDLSNNRLSGPIPEWGSLPTFPGYVFDNNSGLCGLPLPPCNGGSPSKEDVPQPPSTNHESSQGRWIAIGLLFSFFFIIGFVIGLLIK